MNLREDFTFLRENPNATYLDSACMSLKPEVIFLAMKAYYEHHPSCAGRSAHDLAKKTAETQEDVRSRIQKFLGAKKSQEIIFTRNTTEAINIIAHGLDLKGKAVLTTDKEHNSNHIPWLRLAEQGVIEHVILPTTNGRLDMETYEEALKNHDVGLVAIHQHSNLDGIEQPVKHLAKLAHKHGARILIDGAQSMGHVPVNVRDIDADYYVGSGHKMLGPTGTGILYGTTKALEALKPLLLGGDTVDTSTKNSYVLAPLPRRLEAGLQDYAGIIGLGAAVSYIQKKGISSLHKHTLHLANLLREVCKKHDLPILNEDADSTIVTIIPKKIDAHALSRMLSKQEVYARSGAFCCHMYFHEHHLKPALRFSLHCYNTQQDIERLDSALATLKGIL